MQAKKRIPDIYILIALVVVLALVLTFFNTLYLVPPRGNRFDFFPRWRGSQALWSGQSPYSPEITDAIQHDMFGGTLPPTADQQRMVYPAYIGLIIAPLLPLSSSTAIAIWMTIQLGAVLVTPLLWLQILGWKPRPWLLGLLIIGLLLVFRYPINLYIIAQFTGTIVFGFSLAVWLMYQKHDVAAGVILALTAMPPTIAIPLALILLLGGALIGHVRALIAFIVLLAVLTLITIVQIGWWIPDFIAQLGAYPGYAAPVWPPNFLPLLLRVILVAGVAGVLLYSFVRLWRTRVLVDFAVTATIACLLLLPQTGNYYLVLLIPPLLVIFARGSLILRLAVVLAIFSPWFFRSLPDSSLETLILPLYVLVLWLQPFQKRPIIESAYPVSSV